MELPDFLNIGYSHSKQAVTYISSVEPNETFNSHSWTASAFTGGVNALTAGVRYFIGN